MFLARQASARAIGHKFAGGEPMSEDIRLAAFSESHDERISAVGRLRGNLEALMSVLVKSAHGDSAREAQRIYGESLDEKNLAIVNKCAALYAPEESVREAAVLALKNHPDELREVSLDSRYPGTRAMARSMLAI
ncbi:MAG TPA: hypothetical protein VLD37_03925 [Candidatus Bilamarchaeum sp.]|nr:hypothetical protein [Candidatus Bilamarchaeum sp.]